MRARRLLVHVLTGLFALAAGACARTTPPNVVLIVMDTTRADRCSVTGYARPTTPNLDALGRESVVYDNAWSPAGWTGPAHASLFTGLRPENHGFHRANRHFLIGDQVTLAESFAGAGYRTAAFTNNDAICPENGLVQGFDDFVPLYAETDRPYPWANATHRRALEWAVGQADAGRPFFLFVNDMEPHLPYTPPQEVERQFIPAGLSPVEVRRGRDTTSTWLFAHNAGIRKIPDADRRVLSDLYDAEVAALDRAVGELVEGLRAADLLDDTVFVVTSDHGENLGEHGLFDHVFSIHGTIRHVPLVIRYPRGTGDPAHVRDVVRLEDIAPTLLEVCGIAPAARMDGESLLGVVSGRVSRGLVDAPLSLLRRRLAAGPPFDIEPLRAAQRAVFDGRFHLIRWSDGREQLFDLSSETPEENVAASEPAAVARLSALLPAF